MNALGPNWGYRAQTLSWGSYLNGRFSSLQFECGRSSHKREVEEEKVRKIAMRRHIKKLPRGCQFSIIFLSCKNTWARYSHIPRQQACTCPLVARAVRCRDYPPPTAPSICWGGSAWEASSACMRAEGGFPTGGPPGGGASHGGLSA